MTATTVNPAIEPTDDLFRKHERLIWKIVNAVQLHAPFMDADDMFAEAALKWVEVIRRFNADGVRRQTVSPGHLTHYVYVALRRRLIDYCQKQSKHFVNCVTDDDDTVRAIPDRSGTPVEQQIRMADVAALGPTAQRRVAEVLELQPRAGGRLRPKQVAEVRQQVATALL
jgi:DNA-directed RNA polymerase specialized sigma24 family protein